MGFLNCIMATMNIGKEAKVLQNYGNFAQDDLRVAELVAWLD